MGENADSISAEGAISSMRIYKNGPRNAAKVRSALRYLYGDNCCWCGTKMNFNLTSAPPSFDSATIEHLVPLSKGGNNSMDNLRLACTFCNSSRNNEDAPPVFPPPKRAFRRVKFTVWTELDSVLSWYILRPWSLSCLKFLKCASAPDKTMFIAFSWPALCAELPICLGKPYSTSCDDKAYQSAKKLDFPPRVAYSWAWQDVQEAETFSQKLWPRFWSLTML